MGLSVNKFIYAGDDEFDLNFALGYASRSDVTCYRDGAVPVNVTFDWLTDSRVRVDSSNLSEGDIVVFRRTVSKTALPVDLAQPGNLTRENVQTAVLHSLYAFHELLDGRFGELVEISDAVYGLINEAVSESLKNFLFTADFKRDLVFSAGLVSPRGVCWTTGGEVINTEDAYFEVINAPSADVELLIQHNGQVVLAVTVDTHGNYEFSTTSTFETVPGAFTHAEASNVYTSGLEYACALPAVHRSVVDFGTALGDYIEIFETARLT